MSAVATAGQRLSRFGKAPPIRKKLPKHPHTGLPQPHVNVLVRDFAPCRLRDHYHTTLEDDLMYLTYKHDPNPRPPRTVRLTYDPANPYTKNRINPPVGGWLGGKQPAPPSSPDNIVRLERIQIHTMIKEAVASRSNLLGVIMMMRALSGETAGGGGRVNSEGVQVVYGRKSEHGWIRPGIPVGAKVDITGPNMYDFIGTLVEFVLPRVRDFNGVNIPPMSSSPNSPSAVSGVVSFGLPPTAMGFFPQIEVNVDAYPKAYGMHIHFITNTEGLGAQNRARALLSGFQIPFLRRAS